MINIVGQLQNIKQNLLGTASIPKFQSNITHFLASTSTAHNNIGEGQSCYGEKLPMAWGVPQQTEKPQKSIPSKHARETKHLTLKDLESYLIPDD